MPRCIFRLSYLIPAFAACRSNSRRRIDRRLRDPQNRIGRLLGAGKRDAEIIEELYLAALSRPPNAAEQQATLTHVAGASDRRTALEDILWALLNSKEFLLRR